MDGIYRDKYMDKNIRINMDLTLNSIRDFAFEILWKASTLFDFAVKNMVFEPFFFSEMPWTRWLQPASCNHNQEMATVTDYVIDIYTILYLENSEGALKKAHPSHPTKLHGFKALRCLEPLVGCRLSH